jgi:hypothetical protein
LCSDPRSKRQQVILSSAQALTAHDAKSEVRTGESGAACQTGTAPPKKIVSHLPVSAQSYGSADQVHFHHAGRSGADHVRLPISIILQKFAMRYDRKVDKVLLVFLRASLYCTFQPDSMADILRHQTLPIQG